MRIFTPKLIKKIFATMVVSGLVAGMTITVYATGGVTLSSRGNIGYNADGEGDPDVYFSSSDLENLNTSLSTVNSSVSALSSRVGAAEADVTTIKNTLGGGTGTELTTVMQNLLTSLNTKTGQNASTLQAAVNGMADPGDNVKYPALTPTGRQETEYGVVGSLNGYYNNKNLKILQGSNYGINATHAYENMYEDGKTVSSETSAPYVTDSNATHAGVLTITPPAGYYDGEKSIYVDTKEIVDNAQNDFKEFCKNMVLGNSYKRYQPYDNTISFPEGGYYCDETTKTCYVYTRIIGNNVPYILSLKNTDGNDLPVLTNPNYASAAHMTTIPMNTTSPVDSVGSCLYFGHVSNAYLEIEGGNYNQSFDTYMYGAFAYRDKNY